MKRKRQQERIDLERDTWELGCGRAQFRRLRRNPGFTTLMALGRLVNMLRFAQGAILGLGNNDSPFARRQHANSLFLLAALLVEGFDLIPRLCEHFKSYRSFQEGLAALASDRRTRDLVQGRLRRIRKKSAFHFDDDVVSEALKGAGEKFVTILSSHGDRAGFYLVQGGIRGPGQAGAGGVGRARDFILARVR